MRADKPGACRRAVEPSGRDDDRVLRHRADALPRSGDLHDAHAGDLGLVGMHAQQLLARGLADQLPDAARARAPRAARSRSRARARRRSRTTCRRTRRRPRACRSPPPRASRRGARRTTARSSARRSRRGRRDTRARTSTSPAGASSRNIVSGSCIATHPGLEQHGRDADRVRARHRRILGRLHHDVARVAVVARRRHDQVRVHRDRAARLAQQEAAQRVVTLQRLHLLEDGSPRAAGRRRPRPRCPTSPPAWQQTTVIVRRVSASTPSLRTPRRASHRRRR